MITLGAVADDLTGATDIALMLAAGGLRTVVAVGADAVHEAASDEVDAVVVALKSRTAPVADAVADSLAAVRRLRDHGAQRLYIKYCSTFDSTPEGNIGPVIAAVLDDVGAPVTVVVPTFPATGRTVYQGHLFVGDRLLAESPMRDHPLTPMRDSDLPRLLRAQTTHPVALLPLDIVHQGPTAVRERIDALAADGARMVVVDALTDTDLATIADGTGHLTVLTGGSALAAHLGRESGGPAHTEIRAHPAVPAENGPRIVLSGSASTATRRQVLAGLAAGTGIRVDVTELRTDREGTVSRIVAAALDASVRPVPVVVYTVAQAADLGDTADAPLLEAALGDIAARLVASGVRRLVVAGGETSGAVIAALGVRTVTLGPPLSPGVAWSRATRADGPTVDLVLKSGNFGTDDLFVTAWDSAGAIS
jgi:uncharacterized protein YgbK (DUF1537 family)